MNEQEEEPEARRCDSAEPPNGVLHPLCNPALHEGTTWAFNRLELCDLIKAWEGSSKSSIIDSFTTSGLPLGAHRVTDKCHDPLLGFFHSVREMGFKEACKKWPKHMASDVVTPMSLPLPGSSLLKTDSWVVQMYAKRLLNFRTGVVVPLAGVAITEVETRTRYRKGNGDEDLDLVLEEAHLVAALIAGIAGAVLALTLLEAAAGLIVGLVAAAFWEGLSAGVYWVRRHRAEIAEAARGLTKRVAAGAGSIAALGADARRSRAPAAAVSNADIETRGPDGSAAWVPAAPSWVAVTAAAAAIALMLHFGKPRAV